MDGDSTAPTLSTVHGGLSLAGWGVLLPVGAMVARYFKACGEPAWQYAHASIQALAVGLGIAGVATGLILENKHPKLRTNSLKTHKGLGIGILVLAVLQVAVALLRPRKESEYTKYWRWCHRIAGWLAVAGAMFNVFIGTFLPIERDTTDDVSWFFGYGSFAVFILLVCLCLEVWRCARKCCK